QEQKEDRISAQRVELGIRLHSERLDFSATTRPNSRTSSTWPTPTLTKTCRSVRALTQQDAVFTRILGVAFGIRAYF
ncbi:hypothetical protein, partial [Pseudomonas ogarae]|uniref:hypothetical protein n=1 Tax=Pseudomonas ogarae (strain DSM 112162 / CECT 30235 / F113) TaxID=1114970 RepID=UPI00194E784C